MNNLQFIIKDNTRYAMHVAVELCEQGDFDSVADAFMWLMQERDDSEQESGTCENADKYPSFRFTCSECGCRIRYEDHDGEPYMFVDECAEVPRFCPNCGKAVTR